MFKKCCVVVLFFTGCCELQYDIDKVATVRASSASETAGPGRKGGERVLVKFRPGVPNHAQSRIISGRGYRTERIIPQLHIHAVRVPRGQTAKQVIDCCESHTLVEFAEVDRVYRQGLTPNDPWYNASAGGQWHLPVIDSSAAWDLSTGSPDVVIAIIDSGVLGSHEDLKSLMVPGWNVRNRTDDTSPVTGHGTSVAGTAAAMTNNGIGVAGVSWNCKIMPIVASDAEGYSNSIFLAESLVWAADQGARVANMSFGMSNSTIIASAAQYFQNLGGVVIMSAGNSGEFHTSPDNPYIVGVSATDRDDRITSWSTTGNPVDISAPGVAIKTTRADGGYASPSGTSFSAPIVAGVAALIYSVNPELTGSQVRDILKQSSDDLGPEGWDSNYGWGRVNAARAVSAALSTAPPPLDIVPPSVVITAPKSDSIVSDSITVSVESTDDVAVEKVDLYVDGEFVTSDSSLPHEWLLDTTVLENGIHTLQATAYDTAGNEGESEIVSVIVDNDVTDPIIREAHVFTGRVREQCDVLLSVDVRGSGPMNVSLTFGGGSTVLLSCVVMSDVGEVLTAVTGSSPLVLSPVPVDLGVYKIQVGYVNQNVSFTTTVVHP